MSYGGETTNESTFAAEPLVYDLADAWTELAVANPARRVVRLRPLTFRVWRPSGVAAPEGHLPEFCQNGGGWQ